MIHMSMKKYNSLVEYFIHEGELDNNDIKSNKKYLIQENELDMTSVDAQIDRFLGIYETESQQKSKKEDTKTTELAHEHKTFTLKSHFKNLFEDDSDELINKILGDKSKTKKSAVNNWNEFGVLMIFSPCLLKLKWRFQPKLCSQPPTCGLDQCGRVLKHKYHVHVDIVEQLITNLTGIPAFASDRSQGGKISSFAPSHAIY